MESFVWWTIGFAGGLVISQTLGTLVKYPAEREYRELVEVYKELVRYRESLKEYEQLIDKKLN